MIQKIKRILEDHQGTAFPLVIAVVLALLLLFLLCQRVLPPANHHCGGTGGIAGWSDYGCQR